MKRCVLLIVHLRTKKNSRNSHNKGNEENDFGQNITSSDGDSYPCTKRSDAYYCADVGGDELDERGGPVVRGEHNRNAAVAGKRDAAHARPSGGVTPASGR